MTLRFSAVCSSKTKQASEHTKPRGFSVGGIKKKLLKGGTVCFLRQAFDKRQLVSLTLPQFCHMPSVLWTLVPQSMAPATAASPGMSQNVSPTADMLNLNLHLNRIPGKSTCSLQFEKHSFIALFRVYLYPPTLFPFKHNTFSDEDPVFSLYYSCFLFSCP